MSTYVQCVQGFTVYTVNQSTGDSVLLLLLPTCHQSGMRLRGFVGTLDNGNRTNYVTYWAESNCATCQGQGFGEILCEVRFMGGCKLFKLHFEAINNNLPMSGSVGWHGYRGVFCRMCLRCVPTSSLLSCLQQEVELSAGFATLPVVTGGLCSEPPTFSRSRWSVWRSRKSQAWVNVCATRCAGASSFTFMSTCTFKSFGRVPEEFIVYKRVESFSHELLSVYEPFKCSCIP